MHAKAQFGIVFQRWSAQVVYIHNFLQLELTYQGDFIEEEAGEVLLDMPFNILGICTEVIIVKQQETIDVAAIKQDLITFKLFIIRIKQTGVVDEFTGADIK